MAKSCYKLTLESPKYDRGELVKYFFTRREAAGYAENLAEAVASLDATPPVAKIEKVALL